MKLFTNLDFAPIDPIFGVADEVQKDVRTDKVDLTLGVYFNDAGAVPVLPSVTEGMRRVTSRAVDSARYLPIAGDPGFVTALETLVFGPDSAARRAKRVVSLQTPAGTGALRLGSDVIRTTFSRSSRLLLSTPSWDNHAPLFVAAGFELIWYRYARQETGTLDLPGMLNDLTEKARPGDIVLLHASCHNPSGIDPTPAEWDQILQVVQERELIPFIDCAYIGFGSGIVDDVYPIRKADALGIPFLLATSCSKAFTIYRERVGMLSLVANTEGDAARALTHAKRLVRTLYSTPPAFGALVVREVLTDTELRRQWEEEITNIRKRIIGLRSGLYQALQAAQAPQDMSRIIKHKGMFSMTGLSYEQVLTLRKQFGVYLLDNGRMCMAALRPSAIAQVAAGLVRVMR